MSDHGEEDVVNGMFEEPEGYREQEKPFTYESFRLEDGRVLRLRLVGSNPLWGHLLWNGARRLSQYLQHPSNAQLTADRTILELGAGAGLPSFAAATLGARKVVVTDYPDAELIDNLRYNISLLPATERERIVAEGYLWGAYTEPITRHLTSQLPSSDMTSTDETGDREGTKGFDTLLLPDLLFNHSEHAKLISTIRLTLKRSKSARALVVFTPYRPWLLGRDLGFFEGVIASNPGSGNGGGGGDGQDGGESGNNGENGEGGSKLGGNGVLEVRKLFEEVLDEVMFEEDPGDELLRRTVFGFEIFWGDLQ